jgi:hypothetical protein
MACAECKIPYPDELLVPMFVNGGYTQPICGVCALAVTNRVHRSKRSRFDGQQAETMRRKALNWRKRHPHLQPQP